MGSVRCTGDLPIGTVSQEQTRQETTSAPGRREVSTLDWTHLSQDVTDVRQAHPSEAIRDLSCRRGILAREPSVATPQEDLQEALPRKTAERHAHIPSPFPVQ